MLKSQNLLISVRSWNEICQNAEQNVNTRASRDAYKEALRPDIMQLTFIVMC